MALHWLKNIYLQCLEYRLISIAQLSICCFMGSQMLTEAKVVSPEKWCVRSSGVIFGSSVDPRIPVIWSRDLSNHWAQVFFILHVRKAEGTHPRPHSKSVAELELEFFRLHWLCFPPNLCVPHFSHASNISTYHLYYCLLHGVFFPLNQFTFKNTKTFL